MMLAALILFQASLASLLAGLLIHGALLLLQRRWPVLVSRRLVWLAAQGAIGAVFVLSLLPHAGPVVPAVRLPAAVYAAAPANLIPATGMAPATPLPAPVPATGLPLLPLLPWLSWLPLLWLAVYPLGLLCMLLRRWHGRRVWADLLLVSRRLDHQALHSHAAFSPAQRDEVERRGLAVLETDAAISPMLLGCLPPRLLLPRHLHSFSVEQQHLIIEHELTHWRRRDPFVLALAGILQTVLWFNPALRWLVARLLWAQELGCDRDVLAGRPQRQRQYYAAALLQQLQLQMQGGATPAAAAALRFGSGGGVMAQRIKLMRDSGVTHSSRIKQGAVVLGLAGIAAASVWLQPALAWDTALPTSASTLISTPPVLASMPASAVLVPWRDPLAQMRVTSFYGVTRDITPQGHRGIDLAAARGTPVYAVAAGVVSADSDRRYGNFVSISHAGGQRSLYAHLDQMLVRSGETVAAGQLIGNVGATGMATGPHLHFEVLQGELRSDPRDKLAGLDSHATARALRIRKQQFGY